MRAIGTVCEVCEKPTAEPIIHADTGDSFCGRCVTEMIGGERDYYRAELSKLIERVERDRREPDKILCATASARRALLLGGDDPEIVASSQEDGNA